MKRNEIRILRVVSDTGSYEDQLQVFEAEVQDVDMYIEGNPNGKPGQWVDVPIVKVYSGEFEETMKLESAE